MESLQAIELFAGIRPDGQPMVERLSVKALPDNTLQLVRSPAFVKGLASGDVIKADPDKREFEILKHSGNLSVRVFSRSDASTLADRLNGPVVKLGGELDFETPRMLIYSIHVSCGFNTIEEVFNTINSDDAGWQYGNVYDPNDGVTPLNWWQDLLKPE
ncbi:DUF4265 domain-containing protein [Gilvimarinus sp. SDUM040013]|uniref:DUF4265 domain-containing protein n=1 Tax=Gilvimarinus gilvus TaxID=3058038 RepID=A0ABU4RXH5_9GAMM|nr:DUF4265 domain-containing protein [Gilvimarinus sp. SDUM040013]MDO3388702.1 DUF4265 domain-containing protein [Gilvimarinus sp. SDUM040013]MDX6849597.1 DUF4265 domain-containing protein [Gilvimarinus sp. SDUM040013]